MGAEKILIIEDDPDIAELVGYNLEREQFEVFTAGSGEAGLEAALARDPSLILLDLVLPGLQGLEVCRRLRENRETRGIPIIMLTAKGEESDVVVGLEMGADDYVTKPFRLRELVARVRAVLRRRRTDSERGGEVVRVDDLTIDSGRHETSLRGEKIDLTLTEFRLLRALASNAGRVLTRDQLLDRMTRGEAVIIDRNVDVHIRAVRKKLGDWADRIETIRGVGYKFRDPL